MREIKFRAWDVKEEKMLVQDKVLSYHVFSLTPDGLYYKDGKLQNIKLMQYTGLKDKNDKEIYEGDIVGDGLVVKWVKSAASYKVGKYWATKEYLSTLEVIGNIHETPDKTGTH